MTNQVENGGKDGDVGNQENLRKGSGIAFKFFVLPKMKIDKNCAK